MPIEELAPQRQVAVALDGHGSGEVGGGKKAAAGFDLVFGQVQACLIALPERDASGCNWAVDGWSTLQGAERQPCADLLQLAQACQSQFNAIGSSPGNTAAVLLPGAAPRQ